jgi:uncharacterized repeat protein (TIGR02543 family)
VFFSNQGEDSPNPSQKTVKNGFYYGDLPTPERAGYTFGGWWTEPDGKGSQITRETIVSLQENKNFYAKWTALEVGDPGPAGGLIFYDKGSYSDGWRYMEVAPYGWYNGGADPGIQWGGYGTTVGGTSTAVGAGAANTEAIVAKLGAGTYAAKACANYSVTVKGIVYDEWFLPSIDELNLMHQNLHVPGTGGFSSNDYWSSSEPSISSAWLQSFSNGSQNNNNKKNENRVRAVQGFRSARAGAESRPFFMPEAPCA